MKSLYKKGPDNVSENLTKPTKSFTKHVWLSVLGLLLFIIIYLVLTIWFGRLAYNLFRGNGGVFVKLLGGGFAFLSLFMAKGLFIFSKTEVDPLRKYLTEDKEPVLFDYLYKLADEAGAPRPHKVFLSDRVNASVSYDLSIVNLILPSKKNLEIGLGLVNILSLGEFKAVIAHEFGHFAQRSMLLGRYVYVGQQIARKIVNKRDAFDKLLAGISSFDLRVAWIGWILSVLVWAIRALIETCFNIVAIAERALSREMEFQADLVAVSLTGSDALINALYKLQIADEGYNNALDVVNSELANKNAIHNIYKLQLNYIAKMSGILNNPDYGKSPIVPNVHPELNRVFTSRAYNPPQMWSTHPVDKDREENAKRVYIAAEIDTNSSWELLSDPEKYQIDMTASLIKTAKVETTLLSDEESIKNQNIEHFNWAFLNPKYHSSFLNRFAFVNYKTVAEIFELDIAKNEITNEFDAIYTKDLSTKLDQLKELKEEIDALIIAKHEVITAEKRILWHRGEKIKRSEIDSVLELLYKEKTLLNDEVVLHDKKCRNIHFEAAKTLNNGSAAYLKEITTLVHYAEHTITNVHDCAGKFNNVLSVALADGRVSDTELIDILSISDDYFYTVKRMYDDAETIKLDLHLLHKLKLTHYKDGFEAFTLTAPVKENINDWIRVIEGWANSGLKNLEKLRKISLERLLEVEDEVKNNFLEIEKVTTEFTENTIFVVEDYKLLVPGTERKIIRKLSLWDRFFIGDGLFPTIAKAGVSGAMIIGAILLGIFSQSSDMYIYNGLATKINVEIADKIHYIDSYSKRKITINYGASYDVVSKTNAGELIEKLRLDFENPSKTYVYNVANSAAFINYYVFYGYDGNSNQEYKGAKRWFGTSADYKFTEAPSSIKSNSKTSKKVLEGYSNIKPNRLLSLVKSKEEYHKMIRSHVLWDNMESKYIFDWVQLLGDSIADIAVLNKRLITDRNNVLIIRGLMNRVDSVQKTAICKGLMEKSNAKPNNADYYYLSSRCLKGEDEKNARFIKGYNKWNRNPWLAFSAAFSFADQEDWKKSYNAFVDACTNNSSLLNTLEVYAERVRRAANTKSKLVVSDNIVFYHNLENGSVKKEDINYVYYLLQQGKLNEALSFINKYKDDKPFVVRLLAASDNVGNEIMNEFNKLKDDEGIDYYTLWTSLGLKIRQGKDYTILLSKFKEVDIDNKMLVEFINAIKKTDFKLATNILKPIDFKTKSHFYVLANTIMKNKIPNKWRQNIKTILFVNERPYLK